ncbi:MAG TPA: AraC family transcriptional regulator [Anaeromyxobacteraceae bacterium]|nr:AraC family transcriptional regulator [Anaeromyxobacteraceae bacterium]
MATATGPETVERIEWVESQSRRRRDLFRGSFRAEVVGDACPGVRVVRGRGDPGEAPEGYLPSHAVVVNAGPATFHAFSWAGGAWERRAVAPWAVHVLPAGVPHAVRWDDPVESAVVLVAPEFLAAAAGEQAWPRRVELRPSTAVEDRLLAHAVLALAEDVRGGAPGGSLCSETLATALVLHLIRTQGRVRPRPRIAESLSRAQIARVLGHIADHLEANLSLRDLAALVQMDVFRFVRSFKRAVGLPPHQYLLRARVDRAKALLASADLSISQVALSTGFATPSHFATTFRRITRTTPRGYRESLR